MNESVPHLALTLLFLVLVQDVWKAQVNDAAVGVVGNRTQQTNQLVLDPSAAGTPLKLNTLLAVFWILHHLAAGSETLLKAC